MCTLLWITRADTLVTRTVNQKKAVVAMARRRVVPDKNTFERWLEEGLTHEQMADRVFADTGERVTRSAISQAIQRYGLAKEGKRYPTTIPWKVKVPHSRAYQLRMLRLLGRRLEGDDLNEVESKMLDRWLEQMTAKGLIVAYDPNDDLGLVYIDKKFKDHRQPIPIRRKTINLNPTRQDSDES